ncbi:MAG: family N-acetyltransferase [Bacteroidetes bacterium]|nr:family N-acetyltransferase [Bacteroidota bacterium]
MQDLKLIPASEKDIPVISKLAAVIWNQHYPSIIGQEQVDYMLEMMYSARSLSDQLVKKEHLFFLIRFKGEDIGFISVNRVQNNEWFLNKFYIDQTLSAKGLGSMAFKELMTIIRPEKITLTVNRKNHKSINFYFKNGFKIQEVKDIDIGNGFTMKDFVMVKG